MIATHSLSRSKNVLVAYACLLLLAPVILFVLPADHFDTGRSLCISRLLLDIECYGCGMTRAIQHLLHFDATAAWHFNKLSFAVLPLLIFLWLKELTRILKIIKKKDLKVQAS